jgi:hypothetical protein
LLKDIQRNSQEFLAQGINGVEYLDRNQFALLGSCEFPASLMIVAAKSQDDWVRGIDFELAERRSLVGADGIDEIPEILANGHIHIVGYSVGQDR